MGKGDRKTAKGKRTIGSYGVSRKRKESVKFVAKPKKKKAAPKKTEEAAEKPCLLYTSDLPTKRIV